MFIWLFLLWHGIIQIIKAGMEALGMPLKPMLGVDGLIAHSKEKGITFEIISEDEAKDYLGRNNNYFKLSSYRKNYTKFPSGPRKDQYRDLDFAYLIELARIDVEARHILLKMCLDIEHFLKVSLIKAVENNLQAGIGEDGYKIVTDFITDTSGVNFEERAKNISKRSGAISRKIGQNTKNPYCEGLMKKYRGEMPIWVFVEVISFGDLEDLIAFYAAESGWESPIDGKSLDRVRQIRNAAAHNNCIINDLRPEEASERNVSRTPRFITDFVCRAGIGENMRKKKLANRRINQIVHLLYVYDKVVTSENTRNTRLTELYDLLHTRMSMHKDYFAGNGLLTSTHEFFVKLTDSLMDSH